MNHAIGWRENRLINQEEKISLGDIADFFGFLFGIGLLCFELIILF